MEHPLDDNSPPLLDTEAGNGKYNNKDEGCKGCSFLHVCGACFDEHPMHECPN